VRRCHFIPGVLLTTCLLSPQLAFADGEQIAEIVVRGNKRIEADAVLNQISIKPGDLFYADRSDADIRAVYRLGQFQDVQLISEPAEDGIRLVYLVVEKPVIRDIRFVGNEKLKLEKLMEALPLRRNAIFDKKDLDKSVQQLIKRYKDDGYYLAAVEPLVEQRSNTDYVVTFKINEGKLIRISQISFDGNGAFSARKLRGVMETKEKWFMSWLTDAGNYKEEVLQNDTLLLADHYLNNGYIDIKVGEPTVKMADDGESLLVHITINEGEQYRIGQIDFKGDLLYPERELRDSLTLEPGMIFSRAKLRNDIGTLTDMTADKGYAFNNVNPETTENNISKTVDLVYDIEKGTLVSIGRINISGNTKSRDKVVRREMRLMEGDLYSATGFKRSKQNLMNTGYFEEANIASISGGSEDKLDINVDVKEKPTGAFTIGGGYSSLDGVIFQGSISQSNLFGRGLQGHISAAVGGKSNTYSVGLTDPYFLDSRWSLGMDIYRSEREYTDYSRRLTGADIKAGYSFSDFVSTFFMYKYEIKDIYDATDAYRDWSYKYPGDYPLDQSKTSSIYASITHDNTDYRFDPSSGMINTLSVEYAGPGGTNYFVREVLDNTVFVPLKWQLVGSTRLVLGGIQKANSGKKIPIDEKFYLGGIGTLRGYRAREVCPIDERGIYIGGEKELFGNVEVKFPLLTEFGIKGVAFFDYGNTWTKGGLKPPQMLMSYGGGIRWASPMGPLRLEYGIPINPRDVDGKSGRFEFAIGTLF